MSMAIYQNSHFYIMLINAGKYSTLLGLGHHYVQLLREGAIKGCLCCCLCISACLAAIATTLSRIIPVRP